VLLTDRIVTLGPALHYFTKL